jgi:hypothetical protein
MPQLPISGIEVTLRQPAGGEDLMLSEAVRYDTSLALALVNRLASPSRDWSQLCVTDLEALLLLIRRDVLGDEIRTDASCGVRDCGARVDISFRVEKYLGHHRPRVARGVEREGEGEWFRFADNAARFRIPTAADVVATASTQDPEIELLRRCVVPVPVLSRVRCRVETALEALAPGLSHAVHGECKQCRAQISVYFDVQEFVLRELRSRAASIYRDIHLLASRYQWPEESILALPCARRMHYAAMIADGGSL